MFLYSGEYDISCCGQANFSVYPALLILRVYYYNLFITCMCFCHGRKLNFSFKLLIYSFPHEFHKNKQKVSYLLIAGILCSLVIVLMKAQVCDKSYYLYFSCRLQVHPYVLRFWLCTATVKRVENFSLNFAINFLKNWE